MSAAGPFGGVGTPRIVIVGAGFGGIGLAVLLKKARIDTFTIYEQAEQPGGAWWYNRYPGAEVDTVSFVYSYPFKQHRWSRTHAKRPELLRYLNDTIDEFGLRSHLHCGVGVKSARWNEAAHIYHLTLSTGEATWCHALVGATGFLNIPKYPTWPGLDSFQGPKFHSSRWDSEHDLRDLTVAVVGTGSTGTQIVPELAPIVKQLYVFQREPGWVVPKDARDYTPRQRAALGLPWRYRWARVKWLALAEAFYLRGAPFRQGTLFHSAGQKSALKHIEKEFRDRPDLKEAVTPRYPFWGKRLVFNSTFYPSLKLDNVELVSNAVASVTPTGVVDDAGVERRIDALVMATGFQATNYLGTMEVRGSTGQLLQEFWQEEPKAFLGITVPTFPNFFMMYGPGTNGAVVLSMLMHQAGYIVHAVKRMQRQRITAIEVKHSWTDRYHAWLQKQVNRTVWGSAHNYYRGATGAIVTQWPFGPGLYGLLVRSLGRASERTRRRPAATGGGDDGAGRGIPTAAAGEE